MNFITTWVFVVIFINQAELLQPVFSFCPFQIQSSSRRNGGCMTTSTSTIRLDDKLISNEEAIVGVEARYAGSATVNGPPLETKPDYENIHGPLGKWMDILFMVVFRKKLAKKVGGEDSSKPLTDFRGICELALRMNREISDRSEIQKRALETLRSLFPSWLPRQYAVLFSKPFPAFSARMNAWATGVAGTWLMGECEVNDIELDGGKIGKNQGLKVKRCRFLEESQCASVCVNSCKIPTQNFFIQDMGLALTMEPDYETFECQFSFGKTPNAETELLAKSTPCLMKCPAAGGLRRFHDQGSSLSSLSPETSISNATASSPCALMGED